MLLKQLQAFGVKTHVQRLFAHVCSFFFFFTPSPSSLSWSINRWGLSLLWTFPHTNHTLSIKSTTETYIHNCESSNCTLTHLLTPGTEIQTAGSKARLILPCGPACALNHRTSKSRSIFHFQRSRSCLKGLHIL